MNNASNRFIIAASGSFLTELLTEEAINAGGEACCEFIEDHVWQPLENYNSEKIWSMINEHADQMQSILSESSGDPITPPLGYKLFKVAITIYTGGYEKHKDEFVFAPSQKLAEHCAILEEAHDVETLEWLEDGRVSDMCFDFAYEAAAEEISEGLTAELSKLVSILHYDEEALLNCGNYKEFFAIS